MNAKLLLLVGLAKCLSAAYVPGGDSSAWTTLTPSTTLADITTDYQSSFGIAIVTISGSSASSTADDLTMKRRRDLPPVSQIGDGQIQGTYKTTVNQINTAYVTQTTTKTNTATNTATASVTTMTSECDECVTSFTVFTLSGSSEASTTECGSYSTFTSVSGSITYVLQSEVDSCDSETETTSTCIEPTDTDSVTTIYSTSSVEPSSTNSTSAAEPTSSTPSNLDTGSVSCKVNGTLTMTLSNSILKDSSNRIGSIVANRQFQFDGPVPQAGAIYAAGWGISDGKLAIANSTVFYQCLSGTFYNLYDENIGDQCAPVYLEVVNLIDC